MIKHIEENLAFLCISLVIYSSMKYPKHPTLSKIYQLSLRCYLPS